MAGTNTAEAPPRSLGALQVRGELSYLSRRVLLPMQRWIHAEQAAGLMLALGAAVGLAWANSPWSHAHEALVHSRLTLEVASVEIVTDVERIVSEVLMVLFFFVVGLDIKREVSGGQLSTWKRAALPGAAAAGGMALPAALYFLASGTAAPRGWAIPVATDIAFALGVASLLGKRVPTSLKVFLLAFAAADDVGGVLIIATFYGEDLSVLWMGAALAVFGVTLLARRSGVQALGVYVLLGVLLWGATLLAGIHPTIAGVALGLLTPAAPFFSPASFADAADALRADYGDCLRRGDPQEQAMLLGRFEELARFTESPLDRVDRIVRPWVTYAVLPLFALTSAGVAISSDVVERLVDSEAAHGILAGLLIGKPVGILLGAWLVVRVGWASLPEGITWRHVTGAALLGGIGFTVSLFIANLAFDGETGETARATVLLASVVAAVLGAVHLGGVRTS